MTAKKTHRSTHEYLKYLKGEMTPEERYSFERSLEADPFEREAMEGMEGFPAAELEEDLLSIHAGLQKRLRRRKRRTWYYVAATVASILIVGTFFLNIYEIDPGTQRESIPSDESFLHEEAGPDVMKAEAEITEPEAVESEPVAARPAAARPADTGPVAARPVEIEKKALDIADLDMEEDAEVPAPVAGEVAEGEVVAVEAQPGRGEKKGRVMEPARDAPKAAPREMAGEMAREMPKAVSMDAPSQAAVSNVPGSLSGIVISAEDMEPLPGASLVVKGSDSGVVSDQMGRFALVTDPREPATVIASYVGMKTEEYQLTGGVENRVLMQPDPMSLNEVVVVGYDADKSVFADGAVNRLNPDQVEFIDSGAEPEGGLEAFKVYIEEQIRFPAGDTLSKREVVVLKFNVARDGTVSDIQALRSPGDSFTEEAVRLLQEGPAWKPARNESGITEDVVRMRIVFNR